MKHFLIEIGLAIAFGSLLLFAYFAQSLLLATPTLNIVLAALVFCVFAAYMVVVGDGGPSAKTAIFRIIVGILAGATIAALLNASVDGYLAGIVAGAILGLLGYRWAQHL
ncbi:hypothetical protein A9P79_08915 [Cupriavidus taiwanensis]|uniref:hypothetical protein n=1 Tax=Cupriavidus taiwanensis TaxID=164546 RepID=UPI001F006AD0|nr:hypothetical protein [Cupriavidus taiwanensis]ULX52017.1 hypothetical protein A9P79_08915 [Cupriavidus taiwanensis]